MKRFGETESRFAGAQESPVCSDRHDRNGGKERVCLRNAFLEAFHARESLARLNSPSDPSIEEGSPPEEE